MAEINNKDKVLTADHCTKIFGSKGADWHPYIWKACQDKAITKVLRLAAFLAQVKVESGALNFVVENLNYSKQGLLNTFPKYFTAEQAAEYERQPERIANRVYGSRMGNGNEASGDGWKYRGRGLIQLTGKENYTKMTESGVSCLGSNAPYLETKEGAARSAATFWSQRSLNDLADRGQFDEITRRVNGGMKAAAERRTAYQLAIKVLSDLDDDAVINDTPKAPDTPLDPKDKGFTIVPSVQEDRSECHVPVANHTTITEPIVGGQAVYPWNKPYESRSGHLIEIDDTPDKERLHWYHRTGTYTEMQPEGDHVTKSVRDSYMFTDRDAYEVVKGDLTVKVDGQSYHKSVGDIVMVTDGKMSVESPDRVEMKTPMVNCQEVLNVPIIYCQMIHMEQGSKGLGTVADLKARDACHADWAGIADFADIATTLGPASGLKNASAVISGTWAGSHTDIKDIENIRKHFQPFVRSSNTSLIVVDDTGQTDNIVEQVLEDKIVGIEGNLKQKVNNDVTLEAGGDVNDFNVGSRSIASGQDITIKSEETLFLEAKGGIVLASGLLFRPLDGLEQLPEPSKENAGMCIAFFLNKRLKTAYSDGNTWEVQE